MLKLQLTCMTRRPESRDYDALMLRPVNELNYLLRKHLFHTRFMHSNLCAPLPPFNLKLDLSIKQQMFSVTYQKVWEDF